MTAVGVCIFQPVFTRAQLIHSRARYVIGAGVIGQFVLQQLEPEHRTQVTFVEDDGPRQWEGRPVINFREFCWRANPEDTVIFADGVPMQLAALYSCRQRRVLDVRDFFASHLRLRAVNADHSRAAVISSVPRAGRFRLTYFFFALAEVLKNGTVAPNPHKLHAHLQGIDHRPSSLRDVHEFLNVSNLEIGHFVPAGTLASLEEASEHAALYARKIERFAIACARHPELAVLSFPSRPLRIEPAVPPGHAITYVHSTRNIVDQIASLLTVYEMALPRLLARGARDWSLQEFAAYCAGVFRPYAPFALDGMLPLMYRDAIAQQKSLVEIVLERRCLDSLIEDYALQTTSPCAVARDCRILRLCYEDFLHDDAGTISSVVKFIRNAPLSAPEQAQVEFACAATSRDAVRQIERDLGHSISYNPSLLGLLATESHMTSGSAADTDYQHVSTRVRAMIAPEGSAIERQLKDLQSKLTGKSMAGTISMVCPAEG